MKQIYSYAIGICICAFVGVIILAITCRNRIYAWTLGDVPALYEEAIGLYKERRYEEALPLLEQLAGLDTAAYCKFVLGDLYFRGLAGELDYEKALALFNVSFRSRSAPRLFEGFPSFSIWCCQW